MKAWQMLLEERLGADDAPAVLNRDLLNRMACSARAGGGPVPASSLTHWLKTARTRNKLLPVVAGLYLNRYRASPGSLADAVHWLRADAIVSLNTVLGDAGILNNPSQLVTAVVPLNRGAPLPKLGRQVTQAGTVQFFGLPRRILDAGETDDRLEPVASRDHARATSEKALLDWLYLAKSPRSRRTSPPKSDIDLALLNRRRLKRLAMAMDIKLELDTWLKNDN